MTTPSKIETLFETERSTVYRIAHDVDADFDYENIDVEDRDDGSLALSQLGYGNFDDCHMIDLTHAQAEALSSLLDMILTERERMNETSSD